MALMLYLPEEKLTGKRLLKVIAHSVPGQTIEICHSIQKLSERLRKPIFDVSVAVLFVTTEKDLTEILMFKDIFGDLKTIVILPDYNPATITMAHRLRPRYVTWADDDFSGLGLILKRLTELAIKGSQT
ncbi:MAG: hypothetical protein PHN75_11945 [Syntrophales bacterium]|nr:hypothetical protein [Syntrophales bacterium]